MYFNNTFTRIIEFPGDQAPIEGMYRADLVALSVLVAVCGAWAALACMNRVQRVNELSAPGGYLWKLGGGVAFGGAIWGMHFVGMLAFSLPCAISYDFLTTSMSIVPGILASLTAMTVVGHREIDMRVRLGIGSVLMGAGIGAMHYSGMAAMRLPAILLYDPAMAAFSVVVAVGFSFVALRVVEHGQGDGDTRRLRQFVAASILGIAVASMHYVAMQAAIFYPTLDAPGDGGQLSPTVLAIYVGLGALLLAAGVSAAAFAARLQETARILAQEVEQRKDAEREALAGQTRLQAIFDTAVEAIVVIDTRGSIRQWSNGAERIFGYAPSEALGRNISIIMEGVSQDDHDGYLERYHQTRAASVIGIGREVVGRRRDGSQVPIDLSVGETVIDGETLYTGILRDISKRKELESELTEAARAREANALKSNFLAHMSHEMRTPLNAIMGFSEVIKMQPFGVLNDAYLNYANDIFVSGKHLLSMVNSLLDLSKIENKEYDITISEVDLRAILKDTVMLLREQSREKNQVISILVDSDLPEQIQSDRGKLYQILINLLGNAVKYTPQDGRISLRALPCKGYVKIHIEDNGIGMSEEELALALKPFGQVKDALTADISGTGLGLPIVTSLLELLNGEIQLKSRKGDGTTVTIKLPITPGERKEPPAPVSDTENSSASA